MFELESLADMSSEPNRSDAEYELRAAGDDDRRLAAWARNFGRGLLVVSPDDNADELKEAQDAANEAEAARDRQHDAIDEALTRLDAFDPDKGVTAQIDAIDKVLRDAWERENS